MVKPSSTTVTALRARLSDLTDRLLDTTRHPGELLNDVHALRRFYADLTGVTDEAPPGESLEGTVLPQGTAISPRDAARCLDDYVRTSSYLRAVDQALGRALDLFTERPIEVVYAGCGPFAPLTMPFALRHDPSEVRFTLIDIHARSLSAVQALGIQLGLPEDGTDLVETDAVSYRHPDGRRLHVCITETMMMALEKEPQFAVTANLGPQLVPGGLFVPRRVSVAFSIVQGSEPANWTFLSRAPLMDLTAAGARALAATATDGRLPGTVVTIPDDASPRFQGALLTEIEVGEGIVIGFNASGLTCPRLLPLWDDLLPGDRLEFSYCLGKRPGFEYGRLPSP